MASTGIAQERSPVALEKGENVICMLLPTRTLHDTNTETPDEEANGSDRSTDEFTWTVEEETAVRRKLDRVIVPLTTFLYLLCFLDRYGS
jgi:hypothetical protein